MVPSQNKHVLLFSFALGDNSIKLNFATGREHPVAGVCSCPDSTWETLQKADRMILHPFILKITIISIII